MALREKGAFRRFLCEYKPILRRRKLYKCSPLNPQVLPPGISRVEAIEVVAGSEWAQHLAEGWLRKFFPEMIPGTSEYERKKWDIARTVAAGVV